MGKKKCCICGRTFIGYENNPWPIENDGVCCDTCNEKVITERLKLITK